MTSQQKLTSYGFPNEWHAARERLAAIEAWLDPGTIVDRADWLVFLDYRVPRRVLTLVKNHFVPTKGGNVMNRMVKEKWSWIEAAHGMRSQVLDCLRDADLANHPGGQNMTIGALCREIGETEHAYIQSLKTGVQDWSYRNTSADVVSHVARLKEWFAGLDEGMKTTIAAFSDEDGNKTVDRGGYDVPITFQLDVYLQAVLIFLGKMTIYLKAMNKPLPKEIQEYIG
jgi:hypothetical protein